MIDNVEATELAAALATIEKMRTDADSLQGELERAESDRDDLRTEVAGYENDLQKANGELEDKRSELEDAQSEIDSMHEGVGLRSIIERSWRADPIATENDLLSAGLGHTVAVLRIDHQQGRLNIAGAQ